MVIDKYTLQCHIVEAIPQSICDWLIEHKGLSTSMSTVAEWVEAVEIREREILEKEAYNNNNATMKRQTSIAAKAIPARRSAAPTKGPARISQTTHSNECAVPTGPRVKPKQKVPLSEITCHACGKKGHYHGSRECKKTPTSTWLHTMGIEPDMEELPTPQDNDEEEDPFEGTEFNGNPDVGIANEGETGNEIGLGAIIAGIQVIDKEDYNTHDDYEEVFLGSIQAVKRTPMKNEDESSYHPKWNLPENATDDQLEVVLGGLYIEEDAPEDDEVVYVSVMKTPDAKGTPNEEESIATKLLQSVKDDYETRGSGTKPRPAGPSAKQIKAQSLQEWASNPSTKTTQLEQQLETRRLRQGLTMLINVNGTPAYTCWDTGAELDCISPDFTRATSIRATPKKVALKIQLGAKGSTTMSMYEANAQLDFGNIHLEHLVDVVNIS